MEFVNTKNIWANLAVLHFSMLEKDSVICAVNADAGDSKPVTFQKRSFSY